MHPQTSLRGSSQFRHDSRKRAESRRQIRASRQPDLEGPQLLTGFILVKDARYL